MLVNCLIVNHEQVVFILSRDLVVYESIVGSCFNLKNCAYFHDWFEYVLLSDLSYCEWIFGKNFLVHLKQLSGKTER